MIPFLSPSGSLGFNGRPGSLRSLGRGPDSCHWERVPGVQRGDHCQLHS